jgi:c-di-GMP-binding flagellar brake protein YcgR
VTTPERREAVRVVVTARIDVSSLDTRVAMHLADLSAGGFAVRSVEALPVGEVMRFNFATPSGQWAASLTAHSVYSRPDAGGPSDSPSYQTGFQFINPESPTDRARIDQLMGHATSVVSLS